jgi:nucleoside-diphosphate-sugar epimerase
MIIGDGIIARKFGSYSKRKDVLIFDCGVSNSKEVRPELFEEESELLHQAIDRVSDYELLVYFSTCSVYNIDEQQSMYVKHKLEMERAIESKVPKYLIFRKSQIVGNNHSDTSIINYFIDAIVNDREINLWRNAYRNLIDIDDIFTISDYLIANSIFENKIINLANPYNMSVFEILETIELFFDKKAKYVSCNKGTNYSIDISDIEPYFTKIGVKFGKREYLLSLLNKHFSVKH